MRPNAFTYSRPGNLADVLAAMRDGAMPLAGGQSLLQGMRLRQLEPAVLVDLAAVAELSAQIEYSADRVAIGARVTHRQMIEDPVIASEFPWLQGAAVALGDVQVRNRGTVLGNLCWADPRANFGVALMASEARVHVVDPAAPERRTAIPIEEFFTGFRTTALAGRLALAIEIPRQPARRGCYLEFSRQRQDLALANVSVVIGRDYARVAVGGIHASVVRVPNLEAALITYGADPTALQPALNHAFDELKLIPVRDPHGAPAFKEHLAKVQLKRAIVQLAGERVHG